LGAGIGQVGLPAGAAGAEHAVVIDADDTPDDDALGARQLGDRVVEVGAGEAPLGEQGLGLTCGFSRQASSCYGFSPDRGIRGPSPLFASGAKPH
jgi:hypothetical protein